MDLSKRNAREVIQNRPVSYVTIVGSASLWAWGWLAYLSPSLFPDHALGESVGLETSFFVSQATVVLVAIVLIYLSRKREIRLGRKALLIASIAMSFVSLVTPILLDRGLI